jgi:hypothetical protein
MNWLEKTQEMVKSWMDEQEQMWKSWTDSLDAPTGANWGRTIKTWENSFKNFIETQALWTRTWVRNMSNEVDAEGFDEFAKSVEALTNTWVEAQQQLWGNWFEMVKNMDPEEMSGAMKTETTEAMRQWQDSLEKMAEAQKSWAAEWAKMFGLDQD